MPPEVPTHPLVWVGFVVFILALLALDLGVFHRKAHVVSFREALGWSVVWMILALGFAIGLVPTRGREDALEFVTGYLIEMSLSMDNVFVIALVFAYFRVPNQYQHRVLFWGILGAMVMRGAMIGTGVVLIHRFHWMLYVFGGFLVFTGLKMMVVDDEGVHPERNPILRLARRFFPVTTEFEGDRFLTRLNGRRALTPLALVLILVETTDLIFALDSIPAIFAVTQKGFIIFTSNVFAMLGLRSLYFLLAGAIAAFRYLKIGLSLVLIFIGARMLLPLVAARVPALAGVNISTAVSLGVVAVILLIAIGVSILVSRRDPKPPPAA